jgi:transcriptional repressor NrdR
MQCQRRFTTFEVIESVQIVVVKKNGSKELFDKSKLLGGMLKACEKRPVNAEALANDIEAELQNSLRHEVTSGDIGEMVMRKLKDADDVAYVRFASVYREFKDIETFIRELNEMRGEDVRDTVIYPEDKE